MLCTVAGVVADIERGVDAVARVAGPFQGRVPEVHVERRERETGGASRPGGDARRLGRAVAVAVEECLQGARCIERPQRAGRVDREQGIREGAAVEVLRPERET